MIYATVLALTWAGAIVDATIPSYWLVVHPFAGWWRTRSALTLRLLALLWVVLWLVAAALTRPLLWRAFYHSWWAWLAGIGLWLTGFVVYRRAMGGFSLEQLFGVPEFRTDREQRLVTTGIRGRLRHPVYAGHLCILLGNCVSSGLVANYVLLAWFLLTLPVMLHFEERELVARFGEPYLEYKSRVPAIIPRLG